MLDSRVVYYLMYREELMSHTHQILSSSLIPPPQCLGHYPHDPKMAAAAPDIASSTKSSNHLKSYVVFENGLKDNIWVVLSQFKKL